MYWCVVAPLVAVTVTNHFRHPQRLFCSSVSFHASIALAKIVEVYCPRCGSQSQLAVGLVDAFTGELVSPSCPRCGLRLEFET